MTIANKVIDLIEASVKMSTLVDLILYFIALLVLSRSLPQRLASRIEMTLENQHSDKTANNQYATG